MREKLKKLCCIATIMLVTLTSNTLTFAKTTYATLDKSEYYTDSIYLNKGEKVRITINQQTDNNKTKIAYSLDDGNKCVYYKTFSLCKCENKMHNMQNQSTGHKFYTAKKSGTYYFTLRCDTDTSYGTNYQIELTKIGK